MDLSPIKNSDVSSVLSQGEKAVINPEDAVIDTPDFEAILQKLTAPVDTSAEKAKASLSPSEDPQQIADDLENTDVNLLSDASDDVDSKLGLRATTQAIKSNEVNLLSDASDDVDSKLGLRATTQAIKSNEVTVAGEENSKNAEASIPRLRMAVEDGNSQLPKASSSELDDARGASRIVEQSILQNLNTKSGSAQLDKAAFQAAVSGLEKGGDGTFEDADDQKERNGSDGAVKESQKAKSSDEPVAVKSMTDRTEPRTPAISAAASGPAPVTFDPLPSELDAELSLAKSETMIGRAIEARPMMSTLSLADTSVSTARQIAPQISYAVQQSQNGVTEVALSPEELGKVRMTMQTQDNTIALTLLAERPETSDLMRRHIEVLTQDLRSLGYNSINLSFGKHDGSGPETSRNDLHAQEKEADVDSSDTGQPIDVMSLVTDGLDLRL